MIWHNLFIGKPVRGPLHPDYVRSVFSYATKMEKTPSARYLRVVKHSELGSRTNKCGNTSGRTAKLAENFEPEKNFELAENGEQEEDTAELAENGEQEEDTAEVAENGGKEVDTAKLAKNGEREEDTELAENWEDCG